MAIINVQQPDGEIVLASDGNPPQIFPVTDGAAVVDDAVAELFLRVVPGSSRAPVAPVKTSSRESAE